MATVTGIVASVWQPQVTLKGRLQGEWSIPAPDPLNFCWLSVRKLRIDTQTGAVANCLCSGLPPEWPALWWPCPQGLKVSPEGKDRTCDLSKPILSCTFSLCCPISWSVYPHSFHTGVPPTPVPSSQPLARLQGPLPKRACITCHRQSPSRPRHIGPHSTRLISLLLPLSLAPWADSLNTLGFPGTDFG